MRKPTINFGAVILLSLLVFFGCRKTENEPKVTIPNQDITALNFFNKFTTQDPIVKKVINYVEKHNEIYNFVPAYVKAIGTPRWDKALVISKGISGTVSSRVTASTAVDSSIIYIPFVRDSQDFVNASLVVKIKGDSIASKMLFDWQYSSFGYDEKPNGQWIAKDVFNLFVKLDNNVFGTSKFKIYDYNLLPQHIAVQVNKEEFGRGDYGVTFSLNTNENSAPAGRMISVNICNTYDVCVEREKKAFREMTSQSAMLPPCAVWGTETMCTTYWFEIGDGGGGGSGDWGGGGSGPGDGGGGGGGGDNSGNWPPPSNPGDCPPGNAPMPKVNKSEDPCGTGWVPVPVEPEENFLYDPYDVDSIGISNSIRDSFPCIYRYINDSLPNLNYLAQMAGAAVFKDSAYMHLTFDTSTIDVSSGNNDATTHSDGSISIYKGKTKFSAVIKLNPWMLRNSTNEYVLSSIVHEVMHAIIRLRWGQYQNWLVTKQGKIDSNWMKNHYPIYWQEYTQQSLNPTQINSHQIMGTDYVNHFTNLIKGFYNKEAPTSIRDSVLYAMGWGGLRETSAWKALGTMGRDTCKYKSYNSAARNKRTGTFQFANCPSFTTHYLDSLKLTPPCN